MGLNRDEIFRSVVAEYLATKNATKKEDRDNVKLYYTNNLRGFDLTIRYKCKISKKTKSICVNLDRYLDIHNIDHAAIIADRIRRTIDNVYSTDYYE